MSADVRIAVHPATLNNGIVISNCCSVQEERVTFSTLAALEGHAARMAASYGKPCAIWITYHGRRKPRGFADEARRIGSIFYPGTDGLLASAEIAAMGGTAP